MLPSAWPIACRPASGRSCSYSVCRPLGLVESGHGFRGKARAEEPLVVRVQGGEVVGRQILEDAARLAGPAELDEQARECRPMERIPGKLVDRRPNLRLLVGQLATLALEEEPMRSGC